MYRYTISHFETADDGITGLVAESGIVDGVSHVDAVRKLTEFYGDNKTSPFNGIFNINELYELESVITDKDVEAFKK